MHSLKPLVFDIETSPILAYVWGRHDQNIALNQIKDDWYVLAWGAKWLNEPANKVMYQDQRNAKMLSDDKVILEQIWKLLDEADVVITQNGKNFDSKKLNARFIMHGMKPPSPYQHLDTYQLIRRVASFTSSSLEYLTDKLCVKYKKLKHKKFPGMELWKECLKGNKEAWNELKLYNTYDVLSTEELYNKIRGWAPESMPTAYHVEDVSKMCRKCGKTGTMSSNGVRHTAMFTFQRYRCSSCGGGQQGKKV